VHDVVGARLERGRFIRGLTDGCNHQGASAARELYSTNADRAGASLHKHCAPIYGTRGVNTAMRRNARDAETCPLFEGHAVGKRHGVGRGHNRILGGGAKRAVGLSRIAPHSPASRKIGGYSLASPIDDACAIAVGYHAGERHPVAERMLPLLDVTRIDA
jgi:hypothetical protein